MTTQLLIEVKNGSFHTRANSSLLWFVEVFKKSQINVFIDGRDAEPITLTARKEPYEIEITPGYHEILFEDVKGKYRAKSWDIAKKATIGAFTAGMFASAGVSILGSATLASELASGKSAVKDNVLACNLADGDELKISVKPKMTTVQIKVKK